jgi:hypothetical protein
MTLSISFEFCGLDIVDAPFVNDAGGDVPRVD